MPNKEAIRKWVEMLETTDLRQETGALGKLSTDTDLTGYCCLGIACLAFREEHDLPAFLGEDGEIRFGKESQTDVLPCEVADWLDIESYPSNPNLGRDCECKDPNNHDLDCVDEISCSDANDEYGWTFKEIAEAIRKRYLKGES